MLRALASALRPASSSQRAALSRTSFRCSADRGQPHGHADAPADDSRAAGAGALRVEAGAAPASGAATFSARGDASATTLASAEASSSQALAQLKGGFLRFKREVLAVDPDKFRGLACAQSPKTMVIGCCDSRVDPALLLGTSPGDIFVVRNVANLVPPYERRGAYHGTSAALEFAVTGLKVEDIVVLGHQRCGGIATLMRRGGPAEVRNDFIDSWMEIALSASEQTRQSVGHLPFEQQCAHCERESINVSLANLMSFPWIKEAVAAGRLRLHGWYYDMEEASLETWTLRYQISGFERVA